MRKPKAKAKAKAKPKPKSKPDGESTPTPKEGELLNKELSKVQKLKTRLVSVQASATTLKQIIATNAKWSWANHPSNLGALDESLAKLETSIRLTMISANLA